MLECFLLIIKLEYLKLSILMGANMNIKEIENFLKKINSIICARIVLEENEIKEIHIVADMRKNPKQLSRDIQSVLITKFNINIDHKIISVAQIDNEEILSNEFRLKLNTIEHSINQNTFKAKIVLEKNEILYEGTSSGPLFSNNINRLLVAAVINAVENFYGSENTFILEDVFKIPLNGKEAFITLITSFINGNEVLLSGSSVNGNNNDEMVVKSALDAINRVLVKLSCDYQTG